MQAPQTDHRPLTESATGSATGSTTGRAWLGRAEAERQQALLRLGRPASAHPLAAQPGPRPERRRGDRRQG